MRHPLVSHPSKLYKQGNIDGIVDFDPGESKNIKNLTNAIFYGVLSIEDSAKNFVSSHPEVLDHYLRNIERYFNPSESRACN